MPPIERNPLNPFSETDPNVINGTSGDDTIGTGYTDGDGDLFSNLGGAVFAGDGADFVSGGSGNDTIDGQGGADSLFGGDGTDQIWGGDGDDSLWGDAGSDSLYGNAGNDKIIGGAGGDLLIGGAGDDRLYGDGIFGDLGGASPTDTPEPGYGADTLVLDEGNDQAWGGSGDDTFHIFDGFGAHTIVGGETGETTGPRGGDRIDASELTTATTTVFSSAEAGTITNGTSTTNFSEIEQLDLGTGDDRVQIVSSSTGRVNGADGFDTLVLPDPATPGGPAPVVTVTSETPYPGVPGATTKTGYVDFPDGTRMTFENFEEIICFTPGTLVDTANGRVKVEDLQPGDMVLTRDNGYQPLAWVGRRDLSAAELATCPSAAPVRIEAGALGVNLPERAMEVSPRHRMLITGARAELMFGEREVLVTAADLLGLPGVSQEAPKSTSYIHVMCDAHQIIRAEGTWTESFQPGEAVLNALDTQTRAELLGLFPELATAEGLKKFISARPVLNGDEARTLFAA